jgi:hypothetical protein|uniref:ribbon-helix-helix domain-containing protein n=1 Tax=Cephaloticoccus sp. TaxID=1985742 RepID=UPI00404ADCB4
MTTRPKKSATPVTFDLPLDLLAKIEACRKGLGADSASEVIRAALGQFDFAGCHPVMTPHRQVSVRLTADQLNALKRYAKIKDVSVGVLLRMAVEDLPVKSSKTIRPAGKRSKTLKK